MLGIKYIVIVGNGFVVNMIVFVLQQQLLFDINLILINSVKYVDLDCLYGSISVLDMYVFNLMLNVFEFDLLFNINSIFCWGNYFDCWVMIFCLWLQGFYLLFFVMCGVGLYYFVICYGEIELVFYLINIQVDKIGKFVYFFEDNCYLFFRVEYGY